MGTADNCLSNIFNLFLKRFSNVMLLAGLAYSVSNHLHTAIVSCEAALGHEQTISRVIALAPIAVADGI